MNAKHKRVKYACYAMDVSLSVVTIMSPLLFLTFRNMYGISYSQLGLLVLINFFTQLSLDLLFSFFSHKFNIPKAVKITPMLAALGFFVYAVWPFFFPGSVYAGLVIGTVIFSASGGLSEVLISSVIAALPAKDPDSEMSKLHSVYAWGVVFMVIVSTVFLTVFGSERWQWLVMLFILIPLVSFVMFFRADIPKLETPKKVSGAVGFLKNKWLWICVLAIFLGGAAEQNMSQWCSGYLEQSLGIPKVWGDIFGMALFSAMLGLGRSMYAKVGKDPGRVLFLGALGAVVCYLVAALSGVPVVGLVACALTGLCVSMLWPGNLIIASDRFPYGGVFIYAMMASGGDLGASVGPQITGIVTDVVAASGFGTELAGNLGITAEQLGMKAGMLVAALFPLVALPLYFYIWRSGRKKKAEQN